MPNLKFDLMRKQPYPYPNLYITSIITLIVRLYKLILAYALSLA